MTRSYTPNQIEAYVTPAFFKNGGAQARQYHVITAAKELAREQRRGNLRDAIVSVDRRQKKRIQNVKFGGHIEFADASGDVFDLAQTAMELALRVAPYRTGLYANSFQIEIADRRSGKVGTGKVFRRDAVEPTSVVKIWNTADYASPLEARHVPNGILYFVFLTLRREYGRRFSYNFGFETMPGRRIPTPVLKLAGAGVIYTTAQRPGAGRASKKR